MALRVPSTSGSCSCVTCRRAVSPYTRTRKSAKPSLMSASSAFSTVSSVSRVMRVPCGTRVARHAYAGLFQVNSPAFRERTRTSSFVRPHSLSGDRTESSAIARIPGRSPASSDAFVPSRTSENPSFRAASRMRENSALLQK